MHQVFVNWTEPYADIHWNTNRCTILCALSDERGQRSKLLWSARLGGNENPPIFLNFHVEIFRWNSTHRSESIDSFKTKRMGEKIWLPNYNSVSLIVTNIPVGTTVLVGIISTLYNRKNRFRNNQNPELESARVSTALTKMGVKSEVRYGLSCLIKNGTQRNIFFHQRTLLSLYRYAALLSTVNHDYSFSIWFDYHGTKSITLLICLWSGPYL